LPSSNVPRLCEPELEQALLGGVLLDSSRLDQLVDFGPDIFSTPQNRAVAAAILTTWRESRAVDAETVAEALQRSGEYQLCGGHETLTRIIHQSPNSQ
jgi:replicative DNA helicase